jgi:hypothetical protein
MRSGGRGCDHERSIADDACSNEDDIEIFGNDLGIRVRMVWDRIGWLRVIALLTENEPALQRLFHIEKEHTT